MGRRQRRSHAIHLALDQRKEIMILLDPWRGVHLTSLWLWNNVFPLAPDYSRSNLGATLNSPRSFVTETAKGTRLDYQPLFGKWASAPLPNISLLGEDQESGGNRAWQRNTIPIFIVMFWNIKSQIQIFWYTYHLPELAGQTSPLRVRRIPLLTRTFQPDQLINKQCTRQW